MLTLKLHLLQTDLIFKVANVTDYYIFKCGKSATFQAALDFAENLSIEFRDLLHDAASFFEKWRRRAFEIINIHKHMSALFAHNFLRKKRSV